MQLKGDQHIGFQGGVTVLAQCISAAGNAVAMESSQCMPDLSPE